MTDLLLDDLFDDHGTSFSVAWGQQTTTPAANSVAFDGTHDPLEDLDVLEGSFAHERRDSANDPDEWDDDYEWQAGSEGVVVELDLADGTALVSFDES